MNLTVPKKITTSDIVSNSATNLETIWSGATTYSVGSRIYKNNFIYESAKNSNTGKDPELFSGGVVINQDWLEAGFTAVADPYWLIVSMINPLLKFDSYLTTQSITAGVGVVIDDVTFTKEYCNALYMLTMNASSVNVYVADSTGAVMKHIYVDMYSSTDLVLDEYEWCWKGVNDPVSDVYIDLGITTASDDTIRVVSTGTNTVGVGKIVVGFAEKLGNTEWGYTNGTIDYSKITTDDFGETSRRQGKYIKTIQANCRIDQQAADQICLTLSRLGATDCVWDFNNEESQYSHLINFGLLKEWKNSGTSYNDSKISMTINASI